MPTTVRSAHLPVGPHGGGLVAVFCAALCLLLAGCSQHGEVTTAAHAAADQVGALRTEVQEQVAAENAYYDDQEDEMRQAVMRSRSIRLEQRLAADAASFLSTHGAGPVQATDLVSLAQTTVSSWQTTEAQLQTTLEQAENTLRSGRREVATDSASLDALQKKLRTLAAARTKGDLVSFVFGYVLETGDELVRLRAEDDTPSPQPPPPQPPPPPMPADAAGGDG